MTSMDLNRLLSFFQILLAFLICLLGSQYISNQGGEHYQLFLSLFIAFVGILFIVISRKEAGPVLIPDFSQSLWLFTLVWLAIHFLGGVHYQWNPALLLIPAIIVGLCAPTFHSIYLVMIAWAITLFSIANHVFGILPGSLISNDKSIVDYVLATIYPIFNMSLLQLILISVKRPITAVKKVGLSMKPDTPAVTVLTPEERKARESQILPPGYLSGEDITDPSASAMFSRLYLERQGNQVLEDMKDVLNSVVYFMSRNFRAYTSIGFLVSDLGDKLAVNSVVTKSQNFNYDCAIEVGKGIIGGAVSKSAGFITGNLKSYAGTLEYYNGTENINSIMIMRIMDTESKKLQGMLLVDSENVRAFTDEHKELMYRFTQIACAMITNVKLKYKSEHEARLADNQYEIAKKLSEAIKPDEVIDVLLQSLTQNFEHDRIVICIYNSTTAKGNIWKIIGTAGVLQIGQEFDIYNPKSLYGSVFKNRRAVVTQAFRDEERFIRFDSAEPPEQKPQNILLAPVLDSHQAVFAVVGIESNQAGVYSLSELRLLKTIMANVATALSNARNFVEMERQATIDGLTQIANHRRFQDILSVELERVTRYNGSLTLLLMDIDHFKKFNDTYGHPVGDLVLQRVAKALEGSIRNTDYCARYGGEEFVVVLVQTDERQAQILAERVRKAVESLQIPNEGKILSVTVSVGSASFPTDGMVKQELIDHADQAMYQSKQNGRNQVTFYSQLKASKAPPV